MKYDPRARLDQWGEDLLHLGLNGGNFAGYAASKLASSCEYYRNWECKYWILRSCFSRGDIEKARIMVNDWSHKQPKTGKPSANVSTFIPGDHYHVLGTKFDTLEQAISHLESKGYVYAGLIEKHVYSSQGD